MGPVNGSRATRGPQAVASPYNGEEFQTRIADRAQRSRSQRDQ